MYYHIKYHGENWPDSIYWSSSSLEKEIAEHLKYHPNAEIIVYSEDEPVSEKLLELTHQLFEHLKSQNYTIATEEYGDGYFIFDYGPNTVVHFRLKETPGWLYGVWWRVSVNKEGIVSIVGEFFAQYEEEIDKFKPSASYYGCDMLSLVAADGSICLEEGKVISIIDFIRNHPYRAWNGHINFNDEISGIRAWLNYQKRQRHLRKGKRLEKNLYKDLCKFAKIASKLLKYTNNITVEDYGEGIYPRYFFQLIVTPDEGFKEKGCYELWEKNDTIGQLYSHLKTHYNKYYKQGFYLLDLPDSDVYVEIQEEKSTNK